MGSINETADRIAARLFTPKGANDMPLIMCRRLFPHPRTYLMFDGSWEGLKRISRGGVTSWEIDLDFQLRIEIDGSCMIPDTKNNRIKLEKVSKPQSRMMDYDPLTGIKFAEAREFISYPEYTRIDASIMEQGIVEQITALVMKKMADDAKGQADYQIAEGRDNRPGAAQYTQPMEIVEAQPKIKKGRDPLLDPLAK
jgi:hypothetical protein